MKKDLILVLIVFLLMLSGCSKNKSEVIEETVNDNKTEITEDYYLSNNETVLTSEVDFSERDLDSNPDLKEATEIVLKDNTVYTINEEGIYVLSGSAKNFTVKVDTIKDTKVQLVLKDVEIINEDFPVIYVKSANKCFITSIGDNVLTVTDDFKSDNDINTDAVIFSKDDLTLNGNGTMNITSLKGNGISSKNDLKITGGTYTVKTYLDAIEANDMIAINNGTFMIESGKDGFHSENDESEGTIVINDGTFEIKAYDDGIQATVLLEINGGIFDIESAEGMEATYIRINEGNINIYATDDGINASRKNDAFDVLLEINGGYIKVSTGPGDTDCLDANGSIIMNGGTVDLTGQSTFDYDLKAEYNGGTIIINGEVTDEIPLAIMGGNRKDFNKDGFDNTFKHGYFKKDEPPQKR